MTPEERPPAPLEWHPYYRSKTWLLDWLERRGPYADHHDIRIPVIPSVRSWTYGPETDAVEPDLRQLIMTRRRAHGPAPYVGRPFAYMWPIGTDNLGRHIAGEARIVYLDGMP